MATLTTLPIGTISVEESYEDRDCSAELQGERTYRRKLWASTSSALIGQLEVRFANSVPRLGDAYVSASGAFDSAAYCKRVSVRQRNESPYEWAIEAEYSTIPTTNTPGGSSQSPGSGPGAAPGESEMHPLSRPAEVRWGRREVVRVAEAALLPAGNLEAVRNSAGQPFDPPPEKEEVRRTLTVVRNQASYDPVGTLLYENAINLKAWLGFEKETVLCKGITADRQHEKGVFFQRVTYEFEINRRTWTKKILDAGYYELVAGELKLIRDKFGNPLSSPALLDGTGLKLPDGDDPVYLEFDLYDLADFSLLGLF